MKGENTKTFSTRVLCEGHFDVELRMKVMFGRTVVKLVTETVLRIFGSYQTVAAFVITCARMCACTFVLTHLFRCAAPHERLEWESHELEGLVLKGLAVQSNEKNLMVGVLRNERIVYFFHPKNWFVFAWTISVLQYCKGLKGSGVRKRCRGRTRRATTSEWTRK